MSVRLKVLLVEDSEEDARLLEKELERGGFSVESLRVDSGDAFLRALETGAWEIILCDHKMPKFDGLTALALLRGTELDIPFIFVSGAVGEDVAIESLKVGAQDYVTKDNLSRLVPTVKRELVTASVRRNHRLAEETLNRYKLLYAVARDIILFVRREDGRILEANTAAEAAYGYSRDELLSLTIRDLREESTLADVSAQMAKADAGGIFFEAVHRRKDGSCFPVEVNSMGTTESGTRVLLSIIRDITDQKARKEALRANEEKYRTLVDASPDVIYSVNSAGVIVSLNPAFENLTGWDVRAWIGKPFAEVLHPDDVELASRTLKDIHLGKSPSAYELRVRLKSGDYLDAEFTSVAKMEEGEIVGAFGVARDVTARKNAEMQLLESHSRYLTFINATTDLALLKDDQFRYIVINEANARFFGRSVEEIIGKNDFQLMDEISARACRASDERVLKENTTVVSVERNGGRVFESRKFPVTLPSGQRGVGGYIRDVTERDHAEATLHQALEWQQAVFEGSRDAIFISDAESRFTAVNEAACALTGYSREELLQMRIPDLHEEIDLNAYGTYHTKILGGEDILSEAKVLRKDGTKVETEFNNRRIVISGSVYMHTTARDITERKLAHQANKQAEAAIQRERNLFRTMIDHLPDLIYVKDCDGRYVLNNQAHLHSIGTTQQEAVLGKSSYDFHPEELARQYHADEMAIVRSGKPLLDQEEVAIHQDGGGKRWHLTSKIPVKDKNGRVVEIVGISRDITERKKAELALRDSEERLRILFEYAPDAYYLSDLHGNFVDGNREAEKLTGYRREELIGKNFFSLGLLPYTEMSRISHLVATNAKGRSTGPDEFTLHQKEGDRISVEVRTYPVEINGQILVLGIARDIMERKRSEQNLRLQASALEAAANSIVITDSAGTILWVNRSFTRMTGYSAEEILGKNPRILKSGVQESSVYKSLWKTIRSGAVWQGQMVNRRKDGSLYTEEMTITPVHDESGKVKNFVAVKQDVTERMRAEESLHNSEKKYKDIVEFAPVGIYQSAPEGTILTANASLATVLGYDSPAELLGIDISDLYLRRDERQILIQKNEPQGWGKQIELQWRKRDGSPLWIQLDAHAIKDLDGKTRYFEGFVLDITKRKEAEEVIRASEKRFRAVWDHSAEGMRLTDRDGRIIDVNDSYCKIVRMSREQLLGNIFSIIYKPEGEQRDLSEYQRRFDNGEVQSQLDASVTLWNYDVLSLEISSSPIDIAGHQRMYFSIFRDVSERKRAEKENALLAHTVRSSKDCISVADLDNKILFVNDSFLSTYGYSEEELLGHPISMLWPSASAPDEFKDVVPGTLRGGWHGELVNRRKDGSLLPIELWTSAVKDEHGSPIALVGVARDITERRQSEEALKLFRTLIDRSNNAFAVIDPKTGAFLDVNEKWCQDLGYTREEFLSLKISDVDPSVDLAVFVRQTEELKKRGALIWESTCKRKDGSKYPVEINSKFVRLNREYLIAVVYDISERLRVEKRTKALATLSHELSSVSTREQASKLIANTADEIIGWDACTLDLYSSETDTVHSVLVIDLIDGKRTQVPPIHDHRPPTENMRRVLEEGPCLILREEGEGMPSGVIAFGDVNRPSASLMIVPIRFDTELVGILSIQSYTYHRYTENDLQILQGLADYCGAALERIRSQEDLVLQTSHFRQLFENSPFGILLVGPDDCVVDFNKAFTQIFGYTLEEMKGKPASEFIVPTDRIAEGRSLSQKTLRGQAVQCETLRKRKDGTPVEVALTGYPIVIQGTIVGVYGIYVDITDKKKMQEQFFQAQKMDSIGTLASGIAHDFNNILGIILGHLGLLERIRDNEPQFKESIAAVSNAVDRGASLVRQILTFARKTETELEPVSINNAIKELAKLLMETFPKTITLELKLEKTIPVVSMDPTQLHQTLLNLCVNARDAMNGIGNLSLSTQLVSGQQVSSRFAMATASDYIRVSVTDTGQGMDEETKRHIFEPFFTTKELGKGTGLGLAVVYGVLQAHNGFVDVETSPGTGTTFHLFFPVPDGILSVREKNAGKEQEPPRGTEKILLVEDEDVLRHLLVKLLEMQGYSVIEASDGEEGVRCFSEHAKEIALVLSDFGLPKLNGWDAFKLMQEINPQIRALLASGFVAPGQKSEMLKSGIKQFIYKPYQINEVLKAIRETLDH